MVRAPQDAAILSRSTASRWPAARTLDAPRSWIANTSPTPSRTSSPSIGIASSPAFVRAPEGNGCAERFIRTLKENLLWVRTFDTLEELRQALLGFREVYNTTWLIERHGAEAMVALAHTHLIDMVSEPAGDRERSFAVIAELDRQAARIDPRMPRLLSGRRFHRSDLSTRPSSGLPLA